MNKVIAGIITALVIGTVMGVAAYADEGAYQLAEDVTVSTTVGTITIPAGTWVGGNPDNYITITADVNATTNQGDVTLLNGTDIDCDHPPGYPDPCDPYGN